MTHNEWEIPRFSAAAAKLLDLLHEHGWSMRIVPLVRRSRLEWEVLAAAVNELQERRWVVAVWRRKPRASLPAGLPERCRDIDRITATRYARWRYKATWPNLY